MNFDNQLIFFFSALGAFNGFILSIYFAVKARKKEFSSYFLALLILTLSIRTIKSVFFYFNPSLANIFIQIGLSACILIGPFLYLYLKSFKEKANWAVHVLPFLVGITILGIVYPYVEHRRVWSLGIVRGIYLQWLVYILLSFKYIKPLIFKQKTINTTFRKIDIWKLSIYLGVFAIWLAYNIGPYTSYIVGALSFSFVLYLIILLFIFSGHKGSSFFQEKEKYKNKEMAPETLAQIEQTLSTIIEKELFLNPNLTLTEASKELNISKHTLSQYLNEQLGKSFSTYINELRIEKAKAFLQSENPYTIEGLGYESGFNSKSTFHSTFKKLTGQTPAEYRKSKGF